MHLRASHCTIALVLMLSVGLGWATASRAPRARLVIAYTGDTAGELESCDCSKGVLGGLARRATALALLRKQYGSLLVVDSGNVSDGRERIPVVISAMGRMGYHALGVGPSELCWTRQAAKSARQAGLGLCGWVPAGSAAPEEPPSETTVVSVGSWRIALIGAAPWRYPGAPGMLRARVFRLAASQRPHARAVIVLSQLGLSGDLALARAQPKPGLLDCIIGNNDGASRLAAPLVVRGTVVVPTRTHGKHIGVIRLPVPSGAPPEYRMVPVDNRLAPDPSVQGLVDAYRVLEAASVVTSAPAAGQGAGHSSLVSEADLEYLSPARCAQCHADAYDAWRRHAHSRALATLERRRRLVPECLRCHSEAYRLRRSLPSARTPDDGVQCSTCHGRGVTHAILRGGGDVTPHVGESVCRSCHDANHHPGFSFAAARRQIEHR